MKTLTTFSLLAAVTFGLSTSTFAAEPKMKKDAPAATPAADSKKKAAKTDATPAPQDEAKAKKIPFRGDVAAVDAKAKTFTFKNKLGIERVFAVTGETKITKNDAPAEFAAITVGAYATGSYTKTAEGKLETVKVKIGVKPMKAPKVEKAKAE